MNVILDYMKRNKVTRKEFSRLAGVTVQAISHYVNGRRVPTLKVASRIESNTGIPRLSLLYPDRRKSA